MIHSTDLMLSPTVIVFFAKILQNLLKITFPPLKYVFSQKLLILPSYQNQGVLWGAWNICFLVC